MRRLHDAAAVFGLILFAVAAFGGLTCSCYGRFHGAPERAREALEVQGYTDVEMTGAAPFSCGRGDWSYDGFRAKGPTGVPAKGAVCCGFWTKGCTVRTF